jgi:dUTP pyrophosphatase
MTAETTNSTQNQPIVPTSPPAKRIKTDNGDGANESKTMESSNHAAKQQQEQQSPPLLIKKLSDKARLPTRGSAFAAGYDLYASQDATIPARDKAMVETDISIAVPAGTCKSRQMTFNSSCPIISFPLG